LAASKTPVANTPANPVPAEKSPTSPFGTPFVNPRTTASPKL